MHETVSHPSRLCFAHTLVIWLDYCLFKCQFTSFTAVLFCPLSLTLSRKCSTLSCWCDSYTDYLQTTACCAITMNYVGYASLPVEGVGLWRVSVVTYSRCVSCLQGLHASTVVTARPGVMMFWGCPSSRPYTLLS